MTHTHQPPPARGRRQNRGAEASITPRALYRAAAEPELPKSHRADTRSGHSQPGKAELEAEGELGPQQSSTGRASSGAPCGGSLQFLLARTAGAGLVTRVQSGNYSSTDATGLARPSIYSSSTALPGCCCSQVKAQAKGKQRGRTSNPFDENQQSEMKGQKRNPQRAWNNELQFLP